MSGALSLLRSRGLSPKKSFGQNFLEDARLAARIAELATTPPGGMVLEIGAGLGALTRPLLARAARVVAIERDRELVPILGELFAGEPRLELREADAATLDWAVELAPGPAPRAIAGNLPYQITGRLVRRVVQNAQSIDRAVLMVQREVADRLTALPGGGAYGALSVFTQAAFQVERAMLLGPGAFVPAPKVGSAVVVLTPHASPRALETKAFRDVVRCAFGQRRKTLRNAWRALGLPPRTLEAIAESAGVDLRARAETLCVEDFARVATLLEGPV